MPAMKFFKCVTFTLLYIMIQFNTVEAQVELYDSIKWDIAALLPSSSDEQEQLGLAGPVTGIHTNFLIVGGGANFPDKMPWLGGKKKYYDDLFVFTSDKDSLIHETTFKLPCPIAYGASCSTPRGIVYAGGENEEGLSRSAVLIRWNDQSKIIDFEALPQLPFAVANASMTSIENKVYLVGGELSDLVSDRSMVLDLDNLSDGWQILSQLPYQVSHAVMVSQPDGIYLIGGRKRNHGDITTFYSSVL